MTDSIWQDVLQELDLHACARQAGGEALHYLQGDWWWPELTQEDWDRRYLPVEIIPTSEDSPWVDEGSVNVIASAYGVIQNVPLEFIREVPRG